MANDLHLHLDDCLSVVTEKKYQEMYVNSPGKGVVDKLKGMVGTWFTNPAENQSSQGK